MYNWSVTRDPIIWPPIYNPTLMTSADRSTCTVHSHHRTPEQNCIIIKIRSLRHDTNEPIMYALTRIICTTRYKPTVSKHRVHFELWRSIIYSAEASPQRGVRGSASVPEGKLLVVKNTATFAGGIVLQMKMCYGKNYVLCKYIAWFVFVFMVVVCVHGGWKPIFDRGCFQFVLGH